MANNDLKDTDITGALTVSTTLDVDGAVVIDGAVTMGAGLKLEQAANPTITLNETADNGRIKARNTSEILSELFHETDANSAILSVFANPLNGTSAASIQLHRTTDTSGDVKTYFYAGDGTTTVTGTFTHGSGDFQMDGDLTIGGAIVALAVTGNATVGGVLIQNIGTAFPDTDLTPSVSDGNIFKCGAQASPIEITDFDDGIAGQTITVIAVDGDTDFVTGGNINEAWSPTAGDKRSFVFDGTTWF